jgi:hypothetical protein
MLHIAVCAARMFMLSRANSAAYIIYRVRMNQVWLIYQLAPSVTKRRVELAVLPFPALCLAFAGHETVARLQSAGEQIHRFRTMNLVSMYMCIYICLCVCVDAPQT